jgi:type IV pilus assembly protein PilQ
MYREKNSQDKRKIRNRLFVWCIVFFVTAAIAVADVAQEPAEAYALANTGAAGIETSNSRAGVPAGGKLSFIGFDKEKCKSIRDALRVLGTRFKMNIVPSSNVDGPLTVTSLYDVTFEQALDSVLGYGYKYDHEGNFIKVYTAEEYKKIKEDPDRLIYKVFTLYYISAAEAMELIKPVLSGAGSIQGSSPPETTVSTGESISAGTGGGDTMALNDHIVIKDYPENIVEAEKLLKQLDVRPKQVLIEATILSATLTEGMELGVDLNFLAGVHLDGTSTTAEVGGANAAALETTTTTPLQQIAAGTPGHAPIETFGFARAGGNGLRIGVASGDFSAFITALERVTDTTILANPKILAVNKQLGQVYIGTKIGYISQTTQTQTSTTQQVEFLDTGTKLSFRPYIGDDGYIRMDIHPKDSSGTLKANDIPDEFSTELATNVMVRSGQTIVIGGLFRDVVVTSRSQIPLLGDLPLVGAIFRGTSDQTTRQEVIVLLTPHIIDEPEETNSEARIDDVRRKRYGARDELQWAGRARLVEDRYAKAARHYVEGDTEAAMKELTIILEVRPTYLEAIRLKEKIIAETAPDEVNMIERIMLDNVEREDSNKWQRR